jgi:hypothetical protein
MTTPTIFLKFLVFLGKKFMTTDEPSEYLQYFLKLPKQRTTSKKKKRIDLFKEKLKHLDPLTFKSHIFLIPCLF